MVNSQPAPADKNPTQISDAEAQVMEALWQSHPMTSGAIVEYVSTQRSWSPKTIRTLLTRLTDKGFVARSADRPYRFSPLISRQQWLAGHAAELVNAHCDGRLAPLVAAFSRRERISEQDRQDILRLLDELP